VAFLLGTISIVWAYQGPDINWRKWIGNIPNLMTAIARDNDITIVSMGLILLSILGILRKAIAVGLSV